MPPANKGNLNGKMPTVTIKSGGLVLNLGATPTHLASAGQEGRFSTPQLAHLHPAANDFGGIRTTLHQTQPVKPRGNGRSGRRL